jgi:sterol desaturase/sphingolipid hydroxylase (fatty acid hydroxylase superfamily)
MIDRMEHTATAVRGFGSLANSPFIGATNYYVAMVIDLTVALAFLGLGVHRFVGSSSVAGGVVLLGFLSFGLLEYAVHRWVLHGPPSIARRAHRLHHAQPAALVATPFFVAAVASIAIWQLLRLVCPASAAALFVFGLYAGYNHFALLHHWVHHHRADVGKRSHWRRLDRLHHVHHQRQSSNFGVSTTIWDGVFGTFQPARDKSNRCAVDPKRECARPRASRAGME